MSGFDIGKIVEQDEFSAWVPFIEGIKVKIKHIPREELLALRKKAVQVDFDRRTHQKIEQYDAITGAVILGQAAIQDWEGLQSNGQPFPCTPENIEILMRKWADFARFVDETCTDLVALMEAEMESERKNSGSTSGLASSTEG